MKVMKVGVFVPTYVSLAALFYALVQGVLHFLMAETPKYVDPLARDTLSNNINQK